MAEEKKHGRRMTVLEAGRKGGQKVRDSAGGQIHSRRRSGASAANRSVNTPWTRVLRRDRTTKGGPEGQRLIEGG